MVMFEAFIFRLLSTSKPIAEKGFLRNFAIFDIVFTEKKILSAS